MENDGDFVDVILLYFTTSLLQSVSPCILTVPKVYLGNVLKFKENE